jgi:DNA-binding CsgD family transcriptional regulator/tetratricopeptide (TPR) repeat protein
MVGERQALRSEISAPAFVGRERELSVLGEALSRPPAVVLVEAEPGAGKSRLVREFLAGPAGSRHRMLDAVCPPFREALTLGPIVDAVRQARDGVAGLRLSELAGAIRPLFPEWAASLPPAPGLLDDPRASRRRLFRALAELIGSLEVTGLVVEDVHWADPVTLEFLAFLVSHQPPDPLSLVVTYRPADLPAGSPLRSLSSALPEGTGYVRVELAPLDVAGTAGMVSSMLHGEPVSAAFAGFLHERTGGLPLAVEESVHLLCDRADLIHRGGEWVRRSLAELQVSPTIRDSVLERVQRLGHPAQEVLRAAAVFAEPTGPGVLTQAAGLTPAQAGPAMAEAVGSGLLCADGQGRMAFRHVFMGQVVYEVIPGAERRRLHRRAGRALEAADPVPVVQLTRHFREARDMAGWCRYAEQAAARAMSSGDRTTATAVLNELLGTGELPVPDRARLAPQLAAAALVRREGVDQLHRQVISTLRAVLDAPGLDVLDQARIRSRLGRLMAQQGDLNGAYEELERAIPHLGDDSAEAARAMTYLGWPLLGPWPAPVHLRWLRRAARVDLTGASEVDRLALVADRATALLQLGEGAGWTVAAELPAEPETTEARRPVARGCLNIGFAAMLWGRYQEAGRRLAAGLELADADNHLRLRSRILLAQAELAWLTGSWHGLAEQVAAVLADEATEPMSHLAATRIAGRLQAAAGADHLAGESLVAALEEARRMGVADDALELAAALARLRLRQGRVEAALRLTEEPIGTVAAKGIWVWATDIAPARVEALVASGRVAEAAGLVSAYARGLRGRDAPASVSGLATCRAVLAQARGRPAAARFGRAAAAWDRLPRPYEALLARERQAGCLLAAGHPEEGLALLARVRDGLSDLGARGDTERVNRQLREYGVDVRRPWRGGRRGYGSRPSPRELEVVRLVMAGRTNREIAQELRKSPRTVAGQLGSVMRKLGVSSRTELAVRVVEAGLLPPGGDPAGPVESGTGRPAAGGPDRGR